MKHFRKFSKKNNLKNKKETSLKLRRLQKITPMWKAAVRVNKPPEIWDRLLPVMLNTSHFLHQTISALWELATSFLDQIVFIVTWHTQSTFHWYHLGNWTQTEDCVTCLGWYLFRMKVNSFSLVMSDVSGVISLDKCTLQSFCLVKFTQCSYLQIWLSETNV